MLSKKRCRIFFISRQMKYQAYDLYTRKITIQFFLGALSILFTGAINAQNTEAEDISELPTITVTANKQSETLATVTGSITAFDGNDLENIGARSLADVATMTPSFSFQETGQSTLSPPVMRGMTANIISFSSSAVLLVDGIPTLHTWGFGDRLFGVERVEVLRGPQSTLYGRNAEAGVVNVVTRLPDMHPHTFVSADLGSHGKKVLRADVSRMLVENRLYASFAGETMRQDGFIDNVFTGGKTDDRALHSGRLALRWTPSTATDVVLRASAQRYDDGGATWGAVTAPRYTVHSGTKSWLRASGQTVSLDINHEISPYLQLRSITARNLFRDHMQQDTDFLPTERMFIGRDYHFDTISQELRLEGYTDDRLNGIRWIAGVYADRDDNDWRFTQKTPRALTRTQAKQKAHTTALFTHWTIPLATHWNLLAGIRLEENSVRFKLYGKSKAEQRHIWRHVSPKLALQYQNGPIQVYASYSDGFRAGGFNAFSSLASQRTYQPEKLDAWEIGIKGYALAHRLFYSAAIYRMNVHDMQVQQMPAPGQVFISNAARAHSTGAEAELRYRISNNWQVQAGVALNRTRFNEYHDGVNNYEGHRNPFAPDLQGNLSLRYEAPQGWWAQARLHGMGKIYLDAANHYQRPNYALLDLSAGYLLANAELVAYINNATGKRYDAVGYLNGMATAYSAPREYGLRLSYRF